jgi:hypothetical protein
MNLPVLVAATILGGLSSLAVYRLFFHPLSNVPGPKLAALSRFYDFYYDCILRGKFTFKIEELHQIHGEYDLAHCRKVNPDRLLTDGKIRTYRSDRAQ